MLKTCVLLLALAMGSRLVGPAEGQVAGGPDTVVVQSGTLKLRALLYRPQGHPPFPAALFNHGSGHATGTSAGGDDQRHPDLLGPVFARHGYVFLYLFRRGDGLSVGQGSASGDLMDTALAVHGEEGRNEVQVQLLESGELDDAVAGLAFLRSRPEVDSRRLAVVGVSFGGSVTILLAARDSAVRAAVAFATAGYGWERSAQLRTLLLAAVGRVAAPVFFIHAANDYTIASGKVLGAEMARLGKTQRVKIYPAVGLTPYDGHNFIHLKIATWEPDVFAFLNKHTRR
jgi:dienelactone hydrolase